jgi:hypothetical protein
MPEHCGHFFRILLPLRRSVRVFPMNTSLRNLLLLFCVAALASCAGQPQTASGKKLKLETIQRPFGPTTYLYREVD